MKDGVDLDVVGIVKVVWIVLFDGVSFDIGDGMLDSLFSCGGMFLMFNIIWLIICVMLFGVVLEWVGLFNCVVSVILYGVKIVGVMVICIIFICIGINLIIVDQYMVIVMFGCMYKQEFEKCGLNQLNLFCSLEDGGILILLFILWNICGVYMYGVLMVYLFEYIFYVFFNVINLILVMIYVYFGIKILCIILFEFVVEFFVFFVK